MKRPYSPLVERAGPIEVSATDFKARCLAMLAAVHEGRAAEIVITKRGNPLAKLVPVANRPETFCGFAKDRIVVVGDIFSTGESWNAERGER
ncbi:MAG TPA: type II toxin-antitoxin system prevent-host-death family antitoxin [Candidatus Tumulicola sp.]|nr:type II toxin-antitoxin system prevent-host-death family antitoxin [Candidatus Tumulicola sp.]